MTTNLADEAQHENRIGLPWFYVRLAFGSFGAEIDIVLHMDFDQHSTPTKDRTGHWVFSLKYQGEDVAMIRCWGTKAKEHALALINAILDEP